MKFVSDRAKRQARVAHRERMKRLDDAQARANRKTDDRDRKRTEARPRERKEVGDPDRQRTEARQAHDERMKRLDAAKGTADDREKEPVKEPERDWAKEAEDDLYYYNLHYGDQSDHDDYDWSLSEYLWGITADLIAAHGSIKRNR